MLQRTFIAAVAALLATLLTSSQVYAWGAAHVGYTHVGAGGVTTTPEIAPCCGACTERERRGGERDRQLCAGMPEE